MTDASLYLKVDATQVEKATVSLNSLADSAASTEKATNKLEYTTKSAAAAQEGWRKNVAGAAASMKEQRGATVELDRSVQQLMARYDPLGAKLRALESDFALLNKAAMGGSAGNNYLAIDKTYAGLNAEIVRTKELMQVAGVATEGNASAMVNLGLNTQYARRELMILGREALTGDFSRMPQTFGSLIAHSNIFSLLLNPVTLGVIALGAAGTALAVAWSQGAKEEEGMNRALAMTNDYAGKTAGSVRVMAAEVSKNSLITVGSVKDIASALISSGRIGAESLQNVMSASAAYARVSGESADKVAAHMVKLFSDPAKGAVELNEKMHFLSVADLARIETLQHTNQLMEAQNFLATAMEEHLDKTTVKVSALSGAWHDVTMIASAAWNAMKGGESNADPRVQEATRGLQRASKAGNEPEMMMYVRELIKYQLEGVKVVDDAAVKAAIARKNEQDQFVESVRKQYDIKAQLIKLDEAYITLVGTENAPVVQTAAIQAAELENRKQYAQVLRTIGADERAKTEEQIKFQKDLSQITLKAAEAENDAQLKLGVVKQAQHDAVKTAIVLQMNLTSQLSEMQMSNVKGLTSAQRQSHIDNLVALKLEALAIQQGGVNAALEDTKKLMDDRRKLSEELAKSAEKESVTEVDRLEKLIAAQQLHNAEIGKTAAQRELEKQKVVELDIAQRTMYARALHDAADQLAALGPEYDGWATYYNIRAQGADKALEAQKKLNAAIGSGAALAAADDAAKKSTEKWKHFTDEIERSLTDALMRGFERGDSFGQNFVNSLKHTLETAALKIVVQAIVDPIMGGVRGMAMGGASSGSGGILGDVASLGGFFQTGGLSATGTTVAGGISGGLQGAGVAAETAGTVGTSIAYAMPYAAAAIAAYSLLGNLFGGGGGTPTSNTGSAGMQFNATGKQIGYQTYFGGSNDATNQMITNMQKSYMQEATKLGIKTAATGFTYGGNTGENGQHPNFALSGGVLGKTGFYQPESTSSDAAIRLAASRAVFAALQDSEMPRYLSKLFRGVDVSAMSQQAIDNTLAFAGSVKQVRDALLETRTPLEILRANVEAGTKTFKTSAETFKKDFVAAIDKGIKPATFNSWVELGKVIDQLAAVDAQTAADNAAKVADAARIIADIAKQQRGLDIQLMEATGNAVGALAAKRADEIAALDASLRPTQLLIYAAQDKALADAAAADAASKAADVASKAADATARAAQAAAQAAEQLRNAWQSVTDAIFEQVARIRGVSVSGSAAQFGILTAQARAGDIEAAKLLPSVADAMLNAAMVNANSLVEIARLKGRTAASLEATGNILSFGSISTPQAALPNTLSADRASVAPSGDIAGELRALRAEVIQLRLENQSGQIAVAENTGKTAKLMDRWNGEGMPEVREEA